MMKLLMAAGGTGGHVFPALAIAKSTETLGRDVEILFVGTPKGFETHLVPAAGYPLELVVVSGLKQLGLVSKIITLALLPRAFFRSWKILKKFSPHAVFGIGGYASGPILLLAALTGFRTAILEPNAVPGFSNRILGRLVDRVFLAFEEARMHFSSKKCVLSGNPIRADILAVPPPTFKGKKRTILVFGGSQGARKLNDAVLDSLSSLEDLKDQLVFVHQTGPKDAERVTEAYRKSGFEADVRPFIDDMAEAYGRSDLVIARSGSSVLEIAACGRPSILVPFPFAADDHQRKNARVMEREGAALFLEDDSCDGPMIARLLRALVTDVVRLQTMSERALRLRHADAAGTIAAELLKWGQAA